MSIRIKWAALLLGYVLLGYFIVNVEAPAETLRITTTAYNNVKGQGDGNTNTTACGKVIYKPKTVALSRDLKRKYPCGTKVIIDGIEYKVWDTTSARYKLRADIFMGKNIKLARQYGVKKSVLKKKN